MAKAWRMTPAQWRKTDVDDRAMMVAFELFEGTCEGYRDEYSRKYYDQKNGGGRSGANEFTSMKQDLGLT